jgi:Protein of unknown function (DUF1524)
VAPSRSIRLLWRLAAATSGLALVLGGLSGCQVRFDRPTDPSETRSRLEKLVVAPPASMRGYSRARFPHWLETGDNCDRRDTVLRRDGEQIRLRGCNVVGGRWFSPYDGKQLTRPSKVDVDHVVPLANAWRSGAADWTDERRGEFANDLDSPELLAVSASANRSKGDQDPAQWKPPRRETWCQYAQDWIGVKSHWRLSVTAAEKDALIDMLEICVWPTNKSAAPPT